MTTSKQKNTMNCFQAVYGNDLKNRYSTVAKLRELLESEGVETRAEETNGNMEILVPQKNIVKALKLIGQICEGAVCEARYRPIIYYKRKDARRWMKWYKIEYTYASTSLARRRALLEIFDMKKTDPDGFKQLKFRIKIEEANPENDDEDTDTSLSESQA